MPALSLDATHTVWVGQVTKEDAMNSTTVTNDRMYRFLMAEASRKTACYYYDRGDCSETGYRWSQLASTPIEEWDEEEIRHAERDYMVQSWLGSK